jgi:CCR4-NOT transcription complex subunit 4
MFLHEPGEEAESFSRMELSTANSRQTKDQAHSHTARPAITTRENQPPPGHNEATSMARTNSHAGGDGDGPSALPSTANWAKNPATPATRPASLVHQVSNQKASPTMPSPPLVQTVQTVKKVVSERVKSSSTPSSSSSDNANGKSVGIIGQGAPCASVAVPAVESAPSSASISTSQQQSPSKSKPTQPTMPAYMAEQMERLQKIHKAISDPNFIFVLSSRAFSPDEHDALRKIPHMFDQHGGKKRRELLEKIKNQQLAESGTSDDASRGEPSQQPPIGTVGALGSISLAGIPSRGLTPLQQQQRDGAGQHHQVLQGLGALQQEALQQQQQAALRTQTPQGLLHQTPGQQTFGGAFQNGQGSMAPPQPSQHQPGHARQSSRYTFANENPLSTATSVNPRGNAAHMAEQVRMMPTQPIPHQQLSQIYGGAPGLGGALLGSMQQPPPGLKNAPTPPAPGLGGIPMGNMPGLGQFSGMGLGGHHGKSDSDNQLIRELMAGKNASRLGNASGVSLMRGGDGKRNIPLFTGGRPLYTDRRAVVDLGDPSILQARVAQPQHQMQHQPGIQGGHSQQGGYNPNLNVYYASSAQAGRW